MRIALFIPPFRQTSLLNDTVIKYYVAWCSKDVQRQGGFCTLDGCFVFEQEGGLVTVARKPEANVYIFTPHRMLDPIPEDVKHRVKVFWNTTYWGNGPAFEVCMASWTLALRGENVDRAFWGIGSGGVGQRLQTAHMEAILGNYHSCLDMNIYFVDEAGVIKESSLAISRYHPATCICYLIEIVSLDIFSAAGDAKASSPPRREDSSDWPRKRTRITAAYARRYLQEQYLGR